MSKKTIEEKYHLNWEKLYQGFTADVCDIDCGTLCAPDNNGVPVCCKNDDCCPVLYKNELKWLKTQTKLWKKRKSKTKEEKKEDNEIADFIKHAHCKGVEKCEREYRSLACRFFPFEPYIDNEGIVLGLTYVYNCKHLCPLIEHKAAKINPEYVKQALRTWHAVFAVYPDEFECYVEESRKLRKKFRKKERKIKLFTEKGTVKSITP